MHMNKTATWPLLPSDLGAMLTVSATGWYYGQQTGNQFVERGAASEGRKRVQLLDIGFGLIHQAWDCNPGDVGLASNLLALDKGLGGMLSPAKRIAVQAMAASLAAPEGWRERHDELSMQGGDALRLAVDQGLRADPGNLFWWHQAMETAKVDGLWDWLIDLCVTQAPGPCAPYAALAAADAAFQSARYAEALEGYNHLRAFMEWPGLDQRTGECLLRLGERDAALGLWRESLRQRPWQTNLVLHAHDVAAGLDAPGPHPDGETFLLLYSWNKADSLDRTLASLAASDLGAARIKVLDNGSTDHTPGVVRAWAERLGRDRFEGLSTLVNVGAPAARNWLMHLPDVRESDHAVYMDDDIVLPEDWLARLGAARRAYPEAGVWGCRIVEDGAPHTMQHSDEYLMEPTKQGTVSYCCQYLGEMDFGQYAYLRPSLSVTGCLHLFRTADLFEFGGFDLQFSPSQFDDAERDIRLCNQGGHAVYQGHLAVAHERNTGSGYDNRKRSSYGIDGNFTKLNRKYSAEEINAIRKRIYSLHLADIRAKYPVAMGD